MVNVASTASLKHDLADEARRLGFAACGIAPAGEDPLRAARLEQWLGEGLHGGMDWMESRAHHRRSPAGLWDEARSVIALGMSYAPEADPLALANTPDRARISVYAQGQDYHDTVKKALKALARWLVAEAAEREWVFPPGHFYSPQTSRAEVAEAFARGGFGPPFPGVDLNEAGQVALLRALADFYPEQPFPEQVAVGRRYHLDNPSYGHFDGIMLYLMLRHAGARRVIEVGSGFSSAAMLDLNEFTWNGRMELTFIDPDMSRLRKLLKADDQARVTLIENKVQEVPTSVFAELEAGDVLFIDSSHVSKIGSDVNRLFFDVLPSLAPGAVTFTSNDELAQVFLREEQLHAIAVVDGQRPVAIINRTHFMNDYSKLYFREIWGKKSCLMHANGQPRLIERDHSVEELIGILTSEDQRYLVDGFIVTENGRYAGLATAEDIDKGMKLGCNHPIGPLALADMVGLDVRMAIGTYLATALGNPAFEPPALMREMVAEGKLMPDDAGRAKALPWPF